MVNNNLDMTLTKYVQEYASDPEFIAEGLSIKLIEEVLECLEQRGLNQSWLAEKMGVSRALVSRIFNAPPNMTLLTLARIAVALGTTPDIRLNVGPVPDSRKSPRANKIKSEVGDTLPDLPPEKTLSNMCVK